MQKILLVGVQNDDLEHGCGEEEVKNLPSIGSGRCIS
jgi:hypothetical protein